MVDYRIEFSQRDFPTGRDAATVAVVLWDGGVEPPEYLQFFVGAVRRTRVPVDPTEQWWDDFAANVNRRIVLMVADGWSPPGDPEQRATAHVLSVDPAMFDIMAGDQFDPLP